MALRTLSRTSSKPNNSCHPYLIVTATGSRKPAATTSSPGATSRPHLPTEILDQIVDIAVRDAEDSLLSRFVAIRSFSRSSRKFRIIALRAFLRVLDFGDQEVYWHSVCNMMRCEERRMDSCSCFAFVRSLTSASRSMILHPFRLGSFLNLRNLTIDTTNQGLGTQHCFFKHIFSELFQSPMSTLKQLSLKSVPRLDPSLLEFVSRCFPCLTDLSVSTTERLAPTSYDCPCYFCLDEILSVTFHSPIPIMFSTAERLAQAYSFALLPLSTTLTNLHLGIYLSDEELLYRHAAHDTENFGIFNRPMACDVCDELVGEDVRIKEHLASAIMARNLNSLKYISWSSLFADIHLEIQEKTEKSVLYKESERGSETSCMKGLGTAAYRVLRMGNEVEVQKFRCPTDRP
ncbi:hypothetical protein VKT23_005041 [Stygiomarasmius scandens]|uniref:F-box domain-containing protein n=1 Tax=Marasmiellus scandens TaxID=2682957 RepID=A0ABR1JTH8_9AGAR